MGGANACHCHFAANNGTVVAVRRGVEKQLHEERAEVALWLPQTEFPLGFYWASQ